jgi:hypothetical protein
MKTEAGDAQVSQLRQEVAERNQGQADRRLGLSLGMNFEPGLLDAPKEEAQS